MDAKTIADRYIARDGGPPQQARPGGFTAVRDQHLKDVKDVWHVGAFLAWHDPGELMGGVKAKEACAAFERLMGLPAGKLHEIFRSSSHV